VPFTREDLDDLEPALDGDLPTKYSDGMKSAIHCNLPCLFSRGHDPEGQAFQEFMLEEKRDWTNAIRAGTHFGDKVAARLYHVIADARVLLGSDTCRSTATFKACVKIWSQSVY